MARVAPYALRIWSYLLFFLLLVIFAGAAVGAYYPEFRLAAVESLIPGFYSHGSNLGLSFTLLVIYGILRLLYGPSLRELAIAAAVVIAANYGYELLLPLWNTKDPVDAHYGLVGALVGLGYLAAVRQWGLIPTVS